VFFDESFELLLVLFLRATEEVKHSQEKLNLPRIVSIKDCVNANRYLLDHLSVAVREAKTVVDQIGDQHLKEAFVLLA
jgi:hypothetical protein